MQNVNRIHKKQRIARQNQIRREQDEFDRFDFDDDFDRFMAEQNRAEIEQLIRDTNYLQWLEKVSNNSVNYSFKEIGNGKENNK